MFRVIIAGCRDFDNYAQVASYCDKVLRNKVSANERIVIISGHASGVDKLGEQYAKERGYEARLFPADWKRYGRSAGPKRNEEMAKNADALIAVWDGKSKGTKAMIEYAKQYGLAIRVMRFER